MSVEGREGPELLTSIVDDYRDFTVAEVLTEAEGEISSYDAPSSTLPGDTVTVTATAKNVGSASGSFRLRLTDRDSGWIWDETDWFTLAKDASTSKDLSMFMLSRDLNLRLSLDRDRPVGPTTDDTKSFTVTLQKEEPKGEITGFYPPSSAPPGDTVTVTATAKNIGTGTGSFRLRLRDRDENEDVDSTDWFNIVANTSTVKALSGTMPDRDWRLTLLLERTLPTAAVTIDDKRTFLTVNIDNRLAAIKAWWNGLKTWQKALIIGGSAGGIVAGGVTLYKRR